MQKLLYIIGISLAICSCKTTNDNEYERTVDEYKQTQTEDVQSISESEGLLNRLKAHTWILVSEKTPATGIQLIPDDYTFKTRFDDNGVGYFYDSWGKEDSLQESMFTYTLNGKNLKVTLDDGYIVNKVVRTIDNNKLVLFLPKMKNERTFISEGYKLDESHFDGWITETAGYYSISFPNDWLFSENSTPGTEFTVTGPLSNQFSEDVFNENVNLVRQYSGDMTVQEYINITLGQAAEMKSTDFTYTEKNGHTEFHYSLDFMGMNMEVLSYLWMEKGFLYLLTFTDTKDSFDENVNIGRKILDSFKLLR